MCPERVSLYSLRSVVLPDQAPCASVCPLNHDAKEMGEEVRYRRTTGVQVRVGRVVRGEKNDESSHREI